MQWSIPAAPQEQTPNANDGRRLAVDRIKQRLKQDQRQWSISGRKRLSSSRSSRAKVQVRAPRKIHSAPWNDRFIFEGEQALDSAVEAVEDVNDGLYLNVRPGSKNIGRRTELHIGHKKRNLEGKQLGTRQQPEVSFTENRGEQSVTKDEVAKVNGTSQSSHRTCRSEIRHYTERADGEAVLEFQRREIAPSSTVHENMNSSEFSSTRSVGVSPFDMAKVREALEAHGVTSCDDEPETKVGHPSTYCHVYDFEEVDSKPNNYALNKTKARVHTPKISNVEAWEPLHQSTPQFDYDEREAKSMINTFEEMLYTLELEEELLQRDLSGRNFLQDIGTISSSEHVTNDTKKVSSVITCSNACFEAKVTRQDDVQGKNKNNFTPKVSMTIERKDAILAYVRKQKIAKEYHEKPLTKNGKVRYHELVEILAESMLDSCIIDISREIESVVLESAEEIFQQL